LVIVVVSINMKQFKIASGPDIISRGFVYMRESEDLINDAQKAVAAHLEKIMDRKTSKWSEIKNEIIDTIAPLLYKKTKRRPRSEEHTSELQSRFDLVCRLLLEKKKLNAHKRGALQSA